MDPPVIPPIVPPGQPPIPPITPPGQPPNIPGIPIPVPNDPGHNPDRRTGDLDAETFPIGFVPITYNGVSVPTGAIPDNLEPKGSGPNDPDPTVYTPQVFGIQ